MRNASSRDIGDAAFDALERTIARTPLGRAIGYDGSRHITRAIATTLGIDYEVQFGDTERAFATLTSPDDVLREAIANLLAWAPDSWPDEMGEIGARVDGVGFAANADEYTRMLNGDSDGFGGEGRGTVAPIGSQPVYYALAGGKDGGRSLRAHIDEVRSLLGLDDGA